MTSLGKQLPWLYLALGFTQAAHSIEEMLARLWEWMPVVSAAARQGLAFVPVISMRPDVFAAANLAIVALMLGFSPLPFLQKGWAWKAVTVVAVVETLNGLNHITAAALTRSYFPGCISGAVMIIVSMLIRLPRLHWKRDSK